MTVSVVLADDHPIVLKGLESLLRTEGEFEIVARCTNGEDALRAVRDLRPDLLVLDLNMPRLDGLAVMRELQRAGLRTRVVLLAAEIGKRQAVEALRLGVGGILLKEQAPDLLVNCLRKVHQGEQWYDHRSMGMLLDSLLAREAGMREAAATLTPRELELSRLAAGGMRTAQIAERLHITEGTVKLHLHNIYEKLNIRTRVELVLWAQRKGLSDW